MSVSDRGRQTGQRIGLAWAKSWRGPGTTRAVFVFGPSPSKAVRRLASFRVAAAGFAPALFVVAAQVRLGLQGKGGSGGGVRSSTAQPGSAPSDLKPQTALTHGTARRRRHLQHADVGHVRTPLPLPRLPQQRVNVSPPPSVRGPLWDPQLYIS